MSNAIHSGTAEFDAYIEQGYQRYLENQALHLESIKKRYKDLCIMWNPEIEKEAMRLNGSGITKYLKQIANEQKQTIRQATPGWGAW